MLLKCLISFLMGFFLLGLIVIYELSLFDRDLDVILNKYKEHKHQISNLFDESINRRELEQHDPTIIFFRRPYEHNIANDRHNRRFKHKILIVKKNRSQRMHHHLPIFTENMFDYIQQRHKQDINSFDEKLITQDLIKGSGSIKEEKEPIWERPSSLSGHAQKVMRGYPDRLMGDIGVLKFDNDKRNELLKKKVYNLVPFSIPEVVKSTIRDM